MKNSKAKASKNDSQTQEIVKELKRMGVGITENLDKAWKSQERAKAEKKLKKGLGTFVIEVDKMVDQAKSGSLGEKAQREIIKGLKKTNRVLDKMSKGWTPVKKSGNKKTKNS